MNRICTIITIIGILFLEPSMAGNKFETIGGGVAGSNAVKLASLQPISIGFGLFFLTGAILSLTSLGHKNALSLNYSTWKQTAAILLVLSILSFGVAIFI